MSDKIKFRFLCVFSIIVLCIGVSIKEFQNDTFYLIKIGKDILESGIDLRDHYCWVADLSYTYPHWLYSVFLFFIYDNFGFFGIYFSTILSFISLVLLIYAISLKINKNNEFFSLIVAFLSICGLHLFITARSQVLSLIFLILEIYFIECLIRSGKKRYLFGLMIISLLIANIHATIWLMFFIFYMPYFCEFIICKIPEKYYKLKSSSNKLIIQKVANIKLLFLSFLGSFLMGIFTPSRICYTYILRIMLGNSQSYIVEHFPLVVVRSPVFLLLVGVVFLVLIFTKVKIKLRELFMILGLIVMSLLSGRHQMLLFSIGLLFISVICCRFLELEKDKTFNILYNFIVKNKIIYASIFLIVLVVGSVTFVNNYNNHSYVNKKDFPVGAVKFIKNNLDYKNINLYNEYGLGSYLLFYDIPVFIDSRCDLYLKEFNPGISIFDDYFDNGYEENFVKYNISHVLLSNKSNLCDILSVNSNYVVLYKDKNFTLFERVTEV